MSIILRSDHENGTVGFAPERIAGLSVEARSYTIAHSLVEIESDYPDVVQADVEYLLATGRYQLANPADQEAMTKNKAKAGSIQEEDAATKKTSTGG